MELGGMEENKKSASPKKTNAYSLQDRIVFVDQWVDCLFGCFLQPLDGGGGRVLFFGVLFGFGPKTGDFVVKKRNETPESNYSAMQ